MLINVEYHRREPQEVTAESQILMKNTQTSYLKAKFDQSCSYTVNKQRLDRFNAVTLVPSRSAGHWFEERNVLQSGPLPEAVHPAGKAQHLPLAATPRPGEALQSGL